ncbi:MAG: divergent polysaccharide deacetylase family protein [Flavobacteriaceae bacterium]
MASDHTDDSGNAARRRGLRLPALLPVLTALCLAALAFIAGWALIVDDPLGGEPVARLSLVETPSSAGPSNSSGTGTEAPLRDGSGNGGQDNAAGAASPGSAGGADAAPTPVANAGEQGDGAVPPGETATGTGIAPVRQALLESSPHGDLPRIATDGTMPARTYARPTPSLPRNTPRIAIVLSGLGLSAVGTEEAIRELPAEISMAFAPYGRDLVRLAALARQDGHEVLVQVPMEPYDYPDNDPGPHTLLTGLSERQNIDRLRWVLARFPGYFGVSNYQGAQFAAAESQIEPMLRELRARGVAYFDDGSAPQSLAAPVADRLGLAFAKADVVVDAVPERGKIDEALARLEEIASNRGYAIGSASALPLSVDELSEWSRRLAAKGIVLVPLSATLKDMR